MKTPCEEFVAAIMTKPECLAAMEHYDLLARTLGIDHPYAQAAMQQVLELAPREFLSNLAQELGVLPKPIGYTESGEAAFCLEDVMQHLGVEPDEAQQLIDQFIQEREAAGLGSGLIDPEDVHVAH